MTGMLLLGAYDPGILQLWGDEAANSFVLDDGGNLKLWGDSIHSAPLTSLPQGANCSRNDTSLIDNGLSEQASLYLIRNKFKTSRVYFANDYYDGVRAIGPTGTSRTLTDLGYSSLGAAQVDYPAATSLSDQVDWCALQAMANAMYTDNIIDVNLVACQARLDGQYKINKTITINQAFLWLRATGVTYKSGMFPGETSIQVIGGGGTIDEPLFAIDWYVWNEFQNPPPGRTAAIAGGSLVVDGVKICGNFADVTANDQTISDYKSGVRVRQSSFVQVIDSVFCGTLYDGIYCSAPQLFINVRDCLFDGIQRDAYYVATNGPVSNFSTTVWTDRNVFRNVGRYAMLQDYSGGVQPAPITKNNRIEGISDSYYLRHPAWFVHGVTSPVCYVSPGNMLDAGNSFDAAETIASYWADIHIASDSIIFTIADSFDLKSIFFTGTAVDGFRTTDAVSWEKPYGIHIWIDFTDTRGYRMGEADNVSPSVYDMSMRTMPRCRNIFFGDSYLFTAGGMQSMTDIDATFWIVNAIPGPTTSSVTPVTWTPNTAVYRNRQEGLPTIVKPTVSTGLFYQCFTAGTTGAIEPTWPVVAGNSVTDNGVLWTAINPPTIPTTNSIVAPVSTATPLNYRGDLTKLDLLNCRFGGANYAIFSSFSRSGHYTVAGPSDIGIAAYNSSATYTNTLGAAFSYANMLVVPSSGKFTGFYYQCVTGGVGGSEPATWPSSLGDNCTSGGGVVFKCIDFIQPDSLNGQPRFEEAGNSVSMITGSGAPAAGNNISGNMVWDLSISAGGNMARICTANGDPGTYKTCLPIQA